MDMFTGTLRRKRLGQQAFDTEKALGLEGALSCLTYLSHENNLKTARVYS